MGNFLDTFNDEAEQSGFEAEDIQKFKVQAVLPYLLPILFFLPIVSGNKNSKFCKFHANQQLAWLVVTVILGILMKVFSLIPILGAILCSLSFVLILVLDVMLMMKANAGKAIRIPFIGTISIF